MGNSGSSGGGSGRRRRGSHHGHPPQPPPQSVQPEITGNHYVFAAATPYHSQYPNPNPPLPYYQHPGYYPQPPPTPYDYHHRGGSHADPAHANWGGGRYPSGPVPASLPYYVEHQKAVTIRNDVNIRKETMRIEQDEENPGRFLVTFGFDATVAGSITVIFFAKEGPDCNLSPTKESLLPPVTISFQQGVGQKFRQPSGTGIDFSMFEDAELLEEGDMEVYPLAVKAESSPLNHNESEVGNPLPGNKNSQITQAVFDKENGDYHVKVVKQFLWVNGMRYELQEIYGIGNSVNGNFDANDPGKECVICLSEPRDTTVLPCRHMCLCSGCAKVLRFQTNRCPICRQPVERLLEIDVNSRPDE